LKARAVGGEGEKVKLAAEKDSEMVQWIRYVVAARLHSALFLT
jgi:hypothetical protein